MPKHLVSAHRLFYQTSGRELFSGLSASIEPGELVEVCGPNGSGKTTLLRILAGLQKPDSGQVIRNTDSLGFLGHRLGITRLLTVRENIQWSIAMSNVEVPENNILDTLMQFDLHDVASALVKDLSAGQAKRSALAALVLTNRRMWLLDEPTASLDDKGVKLLARAISEHCRSGKTAIVATHAPIAAETNQRIELGPK